MTALRSARSAQMAKPTTPPSSQQGEVAGTGATGQANARYARLRFTTTAQKTITAIEGNLTRNVLPPSVTVKLRRESDSVVVATSETIASPPLDAFTTYPLLAPVVLPAGSYYIDVDYGAAAAHHRYRVGNAYSGVISTADGYRYGAADNPPENFIGAGFCYDFRLIGY